MLGQGGDPVGDHRRAPLAHGPEQVAAGHDAQPLVPRVVGGGEVGVDVVARGQLGPRGVEQVPAHPGGEAAAEPVHQRDERDVAGADERGGRAQRQAAAEQPARQRITGRHRQHVARRALQHRHVGGVAGQCRHQRHGGGAAADDDDPAPGPLQIRRPVLRVHDLPGEPLRPGQHRLVPALVAVVAGAEEQEPAGQRHGARGGPASRCCRHGPAGGGAAPLRGHHAVPEPDRLGRFRARGPCRRCRCGWWRRRRSPWCSSTAGTRSRG